MNLLYFWKFEVSTHFIKIILIEGNKFQLVPNPKCFAFLFGGTVMPNYEWKSFYLDTQSNVHFNDDNFFVSLGEILFLYEYEYSMISFGVVR
jgi:hypothetical protein